MDLLSMKRYAFLDFKLDHKLKWLQCVIQHMEHMEKQTCLCYRILGKPKWQPCSDLSYLVKPLSNIGFVYQAASNSSLFIIRYELPQPTANQKHDITSWTEAVDNSMAQLEHQAER